MAELTISAVDGENTQNLSAIIPDFSDCEIKITASYISCLQNVTDLNIYAVHSSGESRITAWRLYAGQHDASFDKTNNCNSYSCVNAIKFTTSVRSDFDSCISEIAAFDVKVKLIVEYRFNGTWLTVVS